METFTIGSLVRETVSQRVGRVVDVAEDGAALVRLTDKTRVIVFPEDCEAVDAQDLATLATPATQSLHAPMGSAGTARPVDGPHVEAERAVDPDACPGCGTRNGLRTEVVAGGVYRYRCLETLDDQGRRLTPSEIPLHENTRACRGIWVGGEADVPVIER